jgi:putative transposase
LGLNRASFYYDPVPVDPSDLEVMRLIDAQYLQTPFYGWPRMTAALRRKGYRVNGKRVRRLMRLMGLQAITLRRRLTTSSPGHQVYPYLLRDLAIDQPNLVWCADITYVPMRLGFVYLVVVMDWFSRYILAWTLSNSLDGSFCRQALQQALAVGTPAIFNTDQGSQFTASAFTDLLTAAGVQISMDGRGRVFDNILVERLWRTVSTSTSISTTIPRSRPSRMALACSSGSTIPNDRTRAWLIRHPPRSIGPGTAAERKSVGQAARSWPWSRPVKTGADAGRAASGRS